MDFFENIQNTFDHCSVSNDVTFLIGNVVHQLVTCFVYVVYKIPNVVEN